MKKFFLLSLLAGASLAASAEVIVSPMGLMNEVGFQAENMSPDAASFACGTNQLSMQPSIWNVATAEVQDFSHEDTIYYYQEVYGTKPGWEYIYDYAISWEPVDSTWGEVEDYENVIGYDTIWDLDTYGGTFHSINNSGLAVGSFGSSYGEKYAVKASFGDTVVTYLYSDRDAETGGDAWAVNADGSIILGFYFDADWITRACIWKNGGLNAEDRIDLPAPSAKDFGSEIDYVAARWMSEDASIILGYAQDAINGKWVMVHWTLNTDGSYSVHAHIAKQNFTPYQYDDEGIASWVKQGCLYNEFEPTALSANGEWVMLTATPLYDINNWETPIKKAIRLNLESGEMTTLNLGGYDAPIFYGVADNGTAVGASEAGGVGPMAPLGESLSTNRVGYVWPADCADFFSLQGIFPDEEYFAYEPENGEAAISSISADGTKIIGYTNKTDGISDWMVSSFIAELPELPNGFQRVDAAEKAAKVLMNGKVVILRNGARYNIIGAKL